MTTKQPLSPYMTFSASDWGALRASTPMTLTEEDLEKLRGLNVALSLDEVAKIYEHRLRDPAAALRWTEAAIEHVVEGTRLYEAFAHRGRSCATQLCRNTSNDGRYRRSPTLLRPLSFVAACEP